jgi:hypothetical protein
MVLPGADDRYSGFSDDDAVKPPATRRQTAAREAAQIKFRARQLKEAMSSSIKRLALIVCEPAVEEVGGENK